MIDQKDTDLACTVTSTSGSKIIAFNKFAKLKATTLLHTTVPAGVKSVKVYKYDAQGNKTPYITLQPTPEYRVCFDISELTKYELVYTY